VLHLSAPRLRAWPLAAPYLIAFVLFLAIPVLWTLVLSLHQGGLVTGLDFVGLQNYVDAWADEVFVKTIGNTALYVALVVPSVMILSLVLASLITSMRRFQNVVKVAIFLPLVSSVVPLANAWVPLLAPGQTGFMNYVVGTAGVPPQNWLGSPQLAIPAIAFFELWRGFGMWTVIFVGALGAIPQELYEAAHVDGAGVVQRFRHVTIPMLRPTIVFLLVMGLIWNFQIFDAVYVLTQGGPGYSSYTMAWYVYRNAFLFDQLGLAATMGVVLLVIIGVLASIVLRLLRDD
jgi:multiple sugar transport system permease protein